MSQKSRSTSLAEEHTTAAIRERIESSNYHGYLGDFVLGAVDGTVTTFAIVAGAAGAGLSSGVAIVLGLANVLADGFSMAVSNFLKSRADQQTVQRFREMEEMHIDEIPEGEREEIRQIFANKGFDGPVLDQIVTVITRDRKRWVDTMLTEEWGLQLETPSPARAALTTFLAFLLSGMVPLLPLFMAAWLAASQMFLASALLTAATFFLIGVVRGRFTKQNPLLVGVETLLIGGTAAGLAFGVGFWLRGIALG
jgi:VIT1/CCC1 family predicted Fe2+/Mn2+ transporter